MDSNLRGLSLGETASRFLASLPTEERGTSQQEIYKFVRWFGWERPLTGLIPAEVANYADRLSLAEADYIGKLQLLRAFLGYARKEGWSNTNLALHLKAKKGKPKLRSASRQDSAETVYLTQPGFAELEAELVALRSKRLQAIEEMRQAAADKDFRENVPLQAAREQRGQIEGRIMELEQILKSAVIIDTKQKAILKAGVGDRIILCDLDSGEELPYVLVSSREADPAKGKISAASPIGQAVMGKGSGEIVEVVAPAGKRRYQLKRVER